MTPRQQSVLVGAAVTGIFTTSYLGFVNSCCCLGVILGGFMAVQQYSGFVPDVDGGTGALLGGIAGAAGSVLGFLFNLILRPVGMDYQTISQEMSREVLDQMMQNMEGQQALSPELMEQLQGEGAGMLTLIGLALLGFRILLYAVFGALGGVLGAVILGEERRPPDGNGRPGQGEGGASGTAPDA